MKMIRNQTSDQLLVDLEKMKILPLSGFSDLTVRMKDFSNVSKSPRNAADFSLIESVGFCHLAKTIALQSEVRVKASKQAARLETPCPAIPLT